LVLITSPQLLQLRDRSINLLAAGHQRRAILQSPAVVLNVRELDTLCSERDGESHHFTDACNIGPVHHCVYRKRQTEPHHFGRERNFSLECATIPSNVIRGRGVGVLDRDLDVIEANLPQVAQGTRCDTDARSNQIGVKTGFPRRCYDLYQIAARPRLSAGEVQLHHS
jgi:hypothetical protein